MAAISLLTVTIVVPMSVASQSLSAAYYARDQITAFHLAQEAIEIVRHLRDHNVLSNALGTPVDLLNGLPDTSGNPFVVDARNDFMSAGACSSGICPPLQTDGDLYGYGTLQGESGWTDTRFTRTVRAQFVGAGQDEIRISVTVSWKTGAYNTRTFTISDNLYRWVNDGSGI